MKKIYLVFVLITSFNSYSQDLLNPIDDKDIEGLIERLSQESFGIIYNNFASQMKLGYYAQKVEEYGKNASPYLVDLLKSNDKTLVAHVLLTKLWEKELYFKTEYSYKPFDDAPEINKFTVNNLTWTVNNDSIIIESNNRERIYKYWSKRINECE